MTPVFIESPYAGDVELNLRYLRACLHDSIVNHKEAPFASHGLYTQPGVLDDNIPAERTLGMNVGERFRELCWRTVVYHDLGVSDGMARGIEQASRLMNHSIEFRRLPAELLEEVMDVVIERVVVQQELSYDAG